MDSVCINCGQIVTDRFCGKCGQPNPPKKITLANLWIDFQSRIYGFDGMFPRTIKDLTVRPGIVTREFIAGNRVKYYGPVGYFFLMITVYLLLMSLLSVSIFDLMKSTSLTAIKEGSRQEEFLKLMAGWMTNNMKLFSFGVIPFNAIFSMILFRKSGLNFLQHSLMPFYVHGHVYWLNILSLIVFKLTGLSWLSLFQSTASFILFGIGCSQLFAYQSKAKAFFKGLALFMLSTFTFAILLFLVGYLVVSNNPEYYEMLKPSNNR